MIGLNNEFCSSKEEYEIARLATKCAGLQGKIDDLTADVEHYKSGLTSAIETIKSLERLCDQLGEALQNCANNEDDVMLTRDALEAWRAMK